MSALTFFTICQLIVVTKLKFKTYYGKKEVTKKSIQLIVAKLKKMLLLEIFQTYYGKKDVQPGNPLNESWPK